MLLKTNVKYFPSSSPTGKQAFFTQQVQHYAASCCSKLFRQDTAGTPCLDQFTVKVNDGFWRPLLTSPPSLQRRFSAQPTEVLFDHSCPGRFGTFTFDKCLSMCGITTYPLVIKHSCGKSPLFMGASTINGHVQQLSSITRGYSYIFNENINKEPPCFATPA